QSIEHDVAVSEHISDCSDGKDFSAKDSRAVGDAAEQGGDEPPLAPSPAFHSPRGRGRTGPCEGTGGGAGGDPEDGTARFELRVSCVIVPGPVCRGVKGRARRSSIESHWLVERDERITGSCFSSHSDDHVPVRPHTSRVVAGPRSGDEMPVSSRPHAGKLSSGHAKKKRGGGRTQAPTSGELKCRASRTPLERTSPSAGATRPRPAAALPRPTGAADRTPPAWHNLPLTRSAGGLVQRGTAGAEAKLSAMRRVLGLGEPAGADEERPHKIGGGRLPNLPAAIAAWFEAGCDQAVLLHEGSVLAMTEKRVNAGDPLAINFLGDQHLDGKYGLEKDVTRAVELYERAAELGVKDAHYNLGVIYANGMDVEKDMAKAHYLVAAKLGQDNSLKEVKLLFMDGLATKTDYAGALQGYQEAIKSPDQEEAKALLLLA
ncbi:hypothetical protein THAOC_32363, partial [Thalassiosira oceanica]